jgi:hypothetical protein
MATKQAEKSSAEDMDTALEALDQISAVNLDEVTIESYAVKVRVYKEVDVLDDEGEPVLDGQGKPFKSRKPGLRTAHIHSMVPMSIYNEMMSLDQKLDKADPAQSLDLMVDVVLKIWKISEPWMDKKTLLEGVESPYIIKLFRIFFAKAVKSMSKRGA